MPLQTSAMPLKENCEDFTDVTFTKLLTSKGFTKATIEELGNNGFHCVDDFTNVTDDTIRDLEISSAQKFRVRKFIEELLVSQKTDTESFSPSNTKEDGSETSAVPELDVESSDQNNQDAEIDEDGKEKEVKKKKILRPHEIVYGNQTTGFLEFIYANLLSLENMYVMDSSDAVPFLKHLHYVSLKMMQQYTLEEVTSYDKEVRDTLESEGRSWVDVMDLNIAPNHFRPEQIAKWIKMRRCSKMTKYGKEFATDHCLAWNYSKKGSGCVAGDTCKYKHACILCAASHVILKCPLNRKKQQTRSKEAPVHSRLLSR